MRLQVIAALRSLSDVGHQRARWGLVEEGVDYYDDLTLNVHILYDDCTVLPDPAAAVPDVLHEEEVPFFSALEVTLGALLQDLQDAPDSVYMSSPRWPSVVAAAGNALAVMQRLDGAQS